GVGGVHPAGALVPRGHRGGGAGLDGLRPHPGAGRLHRGGAQPAPQAADREVLRGRDLRRALREADLPSLALAGPRLRSRRRRRHRERGGDPGGGLGPRAPSGADRLRDELRARHPAGRGRGGRLPARAPLARMAYLLTLVTFVPMVGAILLLLLPRRQEHVTKLVTLGTTLVTFVVSLPVYFRF